MQKDKTEEIDNLKYLINSVSVDLIISPFYKKEDILDRIKPLLPDGYDYPINIFFRKNFKEYVDKQYEEIGELKTSNSKPKNL